MDGRAGLTLHGRALMTFRLAPMSMDIRILTYLLLALPTACFVASLLWGWTFVVPALLFTSIYAWVWFRFRPGRFAVRRDVLEVLWPLKRMQIPMADIVQVRRIETEELTEEIGWGLRIGAGGLWGGFGLLWTKRRGFVQMYISRTNGYVWIERAGGRPWLITPDRPDTFVQALTTKIQAS
jgi:hypothetical protein